MTQAAAQLGAVVEEDEDSDTSMKQDSHTRICTYGTGTATSHTLSSPSNTSPLYTGCVNSSQAFSSDGEFVSNSAALEMLHEELPLT